MAQLPGGRWLMQQIGDEVILFERYTEREITKFTAADGNGAARAQAAINASDDLDDEQKAFAHFWSGYFYAYATGFGGDHL